MQIEPRIRKFAARVEGFLDIEILGAEDDALVDPGRQKGIGKAIDGEIENRAAILLAIR